MGSLAPDAAMPMMPTMTVTDPHLQVATPTTLAQIGVAPINVFHQDQYVRVSSDQAMPFDDVHPDTRTPLGRRHSLHSTLHMPSWTHFQHPQEQLPLPFYDEVTTVQVFPAAQQPQHAVAASAMGVADEQNLIITNNTSTGIASPHQQMAGYNWSVNAGTGKATTPATSVPSTRTCSLSSVEGMGTVLPQDDITMPIPFQLKNEISVFNERAHQEDLHPLDFQEFPLEGVDQADIFDTLEPLPQKVPAAPTRPSLLATQQTSCRSLDGQHHSDGTFTLVHGDSTNNTSNEELDIEEPALPSSTCTAATATNSSDKSSPSMDRLRALMAKSIKSMKLLEEHDRRQGLRKCDAQNMMKTARSRKQILENCILKKWDGTPLIAFEKCNKTGSITVSAGPKKVRMTKRRASLAGKAVDSTKDRRRMARRSSM